MPCSDYSDIRDAEPTNFSRAEQKEVYEQIAQLAHINFAKGKLTEDQCSLFKIMDSQDIAMKTLEILNDPELANQMAQTGIKRIETYYLETMLEEAYREVYKSLM